ncbi:hypothetical protein A55_1966 [Vibrio cholerae 1587]|nr:hypothetical protein A55_1966 [Vibrio cholerae 1587]
MVMGRGENSSYPQTNQIHALALAFILLAMNFYFCLCNLEQAWDFPSIKIGKLHQNH